MQRVLMLTEENQRYRDDGQRTLGDIDDKLTEAQQQRDQLAAEAEGTECELLQVYYWVRGGVGVRGGGVGVGVWVRGGLKLCECGCVWEMWVCACGGVWMTVGVGVCVVVVVV